jgi:hypothetical protein
MKNTIFFLKKNSNNEITQIFVFEEPVKFPPEIRIPCIPAGSYKMNNKTHKARLKNEGKRLIKPDQQTKLQNLCMFPNPMDLNF